MAALTFIAGSVALDAGVFLLGGLGWALVTLGAVLAGPGLLGQVAAIRRRS